MADQTPYSIDRRFLLTWAAVICVAHDTESEQVDIIDEYNEFPGKILQLIHLIMTGIFAEVQQEEMRHKSLVAKKGTPGPVEEEKPREINETYNRAVDTHAHGMKNKSTTRKGKQDNKKKD